MAKALFYSDSGGIVNLKITGRAGQMMHMTREFAW